MFFIVRFFLHVLESLTLDLIPSYFRRYLMFNSDNSGVFNDSRKMIDKTKEFVIFPADPTIDMDVFKEIVNGESYRQNWVSSVFAHAITVIILILFSPMLVFAVILYPFIAVFLKLILTIVQIAYSAATNTNDFSPVRKVLQVDGGLGRYSSTLDRKNALSYKEIFRGSDGLTNNERIERNSGFIKSRFS